MNERNKKFNIIGKISEEEKEKVEKELNKRLFEQRKFIFSFLEFDKLKEFIKNEFVKTEEEIKAIELANQLSSNFIKDLKTETIDVPLENIHIISNNLFKKLNLEEGIKALTFPRFQNIIINKDGYNSILNFFLIVLHELLHLKSYLSFFVFKGKNNEKLDFSNYRSGIHIKNFTNKNFFSHSHFKGLYEAIIEEIVKKIFYKEDILNNSIFKKEKEKMSLVENLERKKESIAKNFNIELDDIYFLENINGNNTRIAMFEYFFQRKVLNYLINEIFKEFKDKYKNKEEVFNEFCKAVFQGNMLKIARLVDQTFGRGSFRILGNMGTDQESGINYLETFKELRRLKLNKERD